MIIDKMEHHRNFKRKAVIMLKDVEYPNAKRRKMESAETPIETLLILVRKVLWASERVKNSDFGKGCGSAYYDYKNIYVQGMCCCMIDFYLTGQLGGEIHDKYIDASDQAFFVRREDCDEHGDILWREEIRPVVAQWHTLFADIKNLGDEQRTKLHALTRILLAGMPNYDALDFDE